MTDAVLATATPGQIQVAVRRGGALIDAAIWRPGAPDEVGDRHLGRISATAPAMGGCFVALQGGTGFLPDSQARGLGVGDTVAVRVVRAAQGGKGPRLARDVGEAAGTAPRLLERGPDPVTRLAALHPDLPVHLDDAALYAKLRPSLGARLHRVPRAFDEAALSALDEISASFIGLPGGGRASFWPTPALVAIDVDAGAAAGERVPARQLHLEANRAALPLIAAQIRLRNLSGAIVIDLAGLSSRQRHALAPSVAAALAGDPLGPRFLGFTALGLAEIVRPRVHPPWHEALAGPHAAGLAALAALARQSGAPRRVVLRAAPSVVSALQADPAALDDLARSCPHSLLLRADPTLRGAGWTIEEPRDG